jgi:hypothetical protein
MSCSREVLGRITQCNTDEASTDLPMVSVLVKRAVLYCLEPSAVQTDGQPRPIRVTSFSSSTMFGSYVSLAL